MTRLDLGDETTTMYAEGTDLVVERTFDAPPAAVWEGITAPEHIPHWWGAHGTTPAVEEMDVRPGGRWRWVADATGPTGGHPFAGRYQEVVPGERLVRTLIFDVEPFNQAPDTIETFTMDERDGRTWFRYVARFPSEEFLSGAVQDGMAKGSIESFDRLADRLTEIA